MAYINMDIYEEVEAKDFIAYIKSHYPQCSLLSNKDLMSYIDDHIHSLIDAYLSSLGLTFGDINCDS